MSLRSFLSPIDSLHEKQDREVEAALKTDPRIGSFQRIKRGKDGLGGGELIVDKTRRNIICLLVGPLDIFDRISHKFTDSRQQVANILHYLQRIREELEEFNEPSHFILVRNAASADLITAVKYGGQKTAIILDGGHGCRTWVNMTDGERVKNNMLIDVVGNEKLGIIVQATCSESDLEDMHDLVTRSNETTIGTDIANKTLFPPYIMPQ